jgi:hypothetical protein
MVMQAASVERRRALARALHEGSGGPGSPDRIDPKFATLHVQIVLYRERAAALFRRLVDLEGAGRDVAQVRRALVACSERVETLATIVGAPAAAMPAYEWLEAPTVPRRR